jgi:hypothetical protein
VTLPRKPAKDGRRQEAYRGRGNALQCHSKAARACPVTDGAGVAKAIDAFLLYVQSRTAEGMQQ